MKIYSFLMKQYTWGRRKLILSCMLQLILSAGALINAEIMRRGTQAIRSRNMSMLTEAGILLVSVIVLNILCAFIQKMFRRQAGLLYQEQLQTDILSGVLDSDRETRAALQVGGMLTMIISNAETAVEKSMSSFMGYTAGMLGIAVCTVYMLLIDWRITFVILAFQVAVRLLLRRLDRMIKVFSEKVIAAAKAGNSLVVEILANMLLVRSSGREDFFNGRMEEQERRLYRLKTAQHFLRLGKDDLVWAATSFSEYVIMYGLGGALVSLGGCDVSAVLALAFVIGPFVTAVNHLGYASSDRIEALVNIDSVGGFLGRLQEGEKKRRGMEAQAAQEKSGAEAEKPGGKSARERCGELIRELGFGEWLNSLPQGLDTPLSESGGNISGGQRQILSVMRAVLTDRPVLILDEPFAALDREHADILNAYLERLKENQFILLVSHREELYQKGYETAELGTIPQILSCGH